MFDSRKSRGGYAADVMERRPQSRADSGAIDAAIAAERARTAKLVAEKIKQSQAGLAEAIARLLDEERSLTEKLTKEAVDEAVRQAVERTVADARAAVAQDVKRLAEVAAGVFDQRRRNLLRDIDGLAERVRAYGNPPEMTAAKWLTDADLDGDGQAPAKALLPGSWGSVVYE